MIFQKYCQALVPIPKFQSQTNKKRGPIGTGADNKIFWATHPLSFKPVNG